MILFDSHAHYYDEKFGDENERRKIISDVLSFGVKYVINAGTTPETTRQAISLAEEYDGIYASAGLHPSDIYDISDIDAAFNEIALLARHEKVVAIGEIGLDYHWHEENKELQKYWFSRQMELAEELSLPVIIHDREAHGDCIDIVLKYPNVKGVFHSFSGSRETATELVKRGWYISFSGVITFKNATRLAEIVGAVPSDRLLIETDCPYLTPHPFRGQINNSTYMKYTAEKMAELRNTTPKEISLLTLQNAARLFSKTDISV
ncbi:MAG: TatD family hydrolase [Clostridia bacterium]|nr:TatD family hydrolase [Clostridia bacterium]